MKKDHSQLMKQKIRGNVELEMSKSHFWSVVAPMIIGMHLPLNDVSSIYDRGDDSVCSESFRFKGYHSRSYDGFSNSPGDCVVYVKRY